MADDVRQEKVAAGLKKLRSFQQRANKKKKVKQPVSDNNNHTENQRLPVLDFNEIERSSPIPVGDLKHQPIEYLIDRDKLDALFYPDASKESLLQIKEQINGLISETHSYVNGEEPLTISDVTSGLHERNQQLASKLDALSQVNQRLELQVTELGSRLTQTTMSYEKEKNVLVEKNGTENNTLKEQLRVHIQTIGILVAEKTELQSSLAQVQEEAKFKAGESEELHNKLKHVWQQLEEKEKERSVLSDVSQQAEKFSQLNTQQVTRLKLEQTRLEEELTEFKQESAELSEKLLTKVSECDKWELKCRELQHKLELAELFSKQANSVPDSKQLESVYTENLSLQAQVNQLTDALDTSNRRENEAALKSQMNVQQIKQEAMVLKNEVLHLVQKTSEQDAQIDRLSEHVSHTEDLEKALHSHKQQVQELTSQLALSTQQLTELHSKFQQQEQDNGALSQLVEQQESALYKLRDQEVDADQLLATLQSDKVAASRAVAQNKELKQQLEELQTAIVTHNNDKLRLTDNLAHERHLNREVTEKINEQTESLRQLQEELAALRQKHQQDKEASAQQARQSEASQQQYNQTLHQQLSAAQHQLGALQQENAALKTSVSQKPKLPLNEEEKETLKKSELVAALSSSVQELEEERNQLLHQCDEHESELLEMKKANQEMTVSENTVSQEDYECLRISMEQLEIRFKQTMSQIAELSDEKQHLEHLVTQLQGETETIGDYIALYQAQRSAMKKRVLEKDDLIIQLTEDRNLFHNQLIQLQHEVQQLIRANTQANGQVPEKVASHIEGLITSINETPTVPSKPSSDCNFHPCTVCSGQLINI